MNIEDEEGERTSECSNGYDESWGSYESAEKGERVYSYKNPEGFHGEGELLADSRTMVRNLNWQSWETFSVEITMRQRHGERSAQGIDRKNSHT